MTLDQWLQLGLLQTRYKDYLLYTRGVPHERIRYTVDHDTHIHEYDVFMVTASSLYRRYLGSFPTEAEALHVATILSLSQ